MPIETRTPQHRLADLILGGEGSLVEFVGSRRAEKRSWRLLARDLYEATDGQVDVTWETLRTWCPDREQVAS